MHYVFLPFDQGAVDDPSDMGENCLPCPDANPMGLLCTCKASRSHGLCAHIVAVTCACGWYNVWTALRKTDIRRSGAKKGRKRKAASSMQMQPDSEESEAETDSSGSDQDMSDL